MALPSSSAATKTTVHTSVLPSLALTRITLTNFRSYSSERLIVDKRPVVLTGENGAGKTNFLEAISYLSPGRGLRGAKLSDAAHIRKTSNGVTPTREWAVAGDLLTQSGSVSIGSGWARPTKEMGAERRLVKIDGHQASGPAALSEYIAMVWLTPLMDRLLSGPAADRRRFFDRLVFAIDPGHASRVQSYEKSRRDRKRLLRGGIVDDAWLGALERSMAEQAVAITAARIDLVIRLAGFLSTDRDPFPPVEISFEGLLEAWLEHEPALATEDRFRNHLAKSRQTEIEGKPCDGPHRSDLIVRHGKHQIPATQCSTGEQKAMLISLVVSHAQLLAHLRGAAPVLLLDEIVAHLDEKRRRTLFKIIIDLGAQAWLTGTERSTFAPLERAAQFFTIRSSAIGEEEAIG